MEMGEKIWERVLDFQKSSCVIGNEIILSGYYK